MRKRKLPVLDKTNVNGGLLFFKETVCFRKPLKVLGILLVKVAFFSIQKERATVLFRRPISIYFHERKECDEMFLFLFK